MKGILK